MMKRIKSEKGAIAALVVVTILMFVLILMGTYMAITNLRKSQLESDIRIQELYGGDVARIEEVYNTVAKSITGGLEVGDYIEYNSGINGTILCRVLYAPNSEYGLQIVSDKNVKNVTLGGNDWNTGKNSYNTAIETLNNETEAYINKEYTVNARCVGSMPTVDENKIFIDKDKDKGTETTLILPPNTWASYTRPNGWTSDDTACYEEDRNYKIDQTQMQNVGILLTTEEYWLASRTVNSDTSYCGFRIRNISSSGTISSYYLCTIHNGGNVGGYSYEKGLRPCFSLKTDIKITGGDGSEENPYTME